MFKHMTDRPSSSAAPKIDGVVHAMPEIVDLQRRSEIQSSVKAVSLRSAMQRLLSLLCSALGRSTSKPGRTPAAPPATRA